MKKRQALPQQKYHLDQRADQLIAIGKAAGPASEEISREEVARWLGISQVWLYERERSAEIKPSRVDVIEFQALHKSRRAFYRRGDIIAWLRSRRKQAATTPAEAATDARNQKNSPQAQQR
jgi:hypothetical protein